MNEKALKELLQRYEQGLLTPAEKEKLYARYNQVLEENALDDFDRVKAKTAMQNWAVEQAMDFPKIGQRPLWKRVAWAASIIPLLGFLYFALFKQAAVKEDEKQLASIDSIAPPTDQAIVVLPNGDQVFLKGEDVDLAQYTAMLANNPNTPNAQDAAITIQTPKGGKLQFKLPDGTEVWMNSGSTLTYPVAFGKEIRKVSLEGEAYFEVAKLKRNSKFVPFKVKSPQQEIEVLGTRFNVNCYANEAIAKTTLAEGSIAVKALGGKSKHILSPNQQYKLDGSGKEEITHVSATSITTWKDGLITLSEQDFPTLARMIERNYDVVFMDEELPKGFALTGELQTNIGLDELLEILETQLGVEFRRKGKTIQLIKNNRIKLMDK